MQRQKHKRDFYGKAQILKKSFVFIAVIFMAAAPFFSSADSGGFDPNKLIDDAVFSDTQTFGSAPGVQQFLDSKHSILASTDVNFLLSLSEPQDSSIKQALDDPEPNLGRLRTAAELIWDASQKTGINPQVIIVTLEKEQSLIDGTFSSPDRQQHALDYALGFGCPDNSGCQQIFKGFYFQLFGNFDAQGNRYIGAPASLMRSFVTLGGRGPGVDGQNQTFGNPIVRTSHVGDTIILDNTQGGPQNPAPTQSVTLADSATAALYRYTPHVYNGNYNFWSFFQQWFKYPNGTLIKLASDSQTYIINNGLKSLIPNFVIVSRGLNAAGAITVSPNEFSNLNTGPIYGPADNVVVKIDSDPQGTIYVFEDSIRHPASAFVIKQRGLDPGAALTITSAEAALFAPGSLLTPQDGTLIQGDNSKTVFVISGGKKFALTAATFKQYKYSFKNVSVLPQSEVDSYVDGGFQLPKDGTLLAVKGIPGTYILQNGLIKPVSDTVFKLYKFSKMNIITVSSDEVANAPLGGYLAPPDGTYFKNPAGDYYYFKNGSKHHISPFVFKQRGIASLAVALGTQEASLLDEGTPLAPRDGTLIKGDQSSAIYVITKGQKVGLDYSTWVKKYFRRTPNVLPQSEVDLYPNQGDEQQ